MSRWQRRRRSSIRGQKNLDYVAVPKVNKPIWEVIKPSTKRKEVKLKHIQKNTLRSVVPVSKVMQTLYEHRETPEIWMFIS